MTTPRKPPRAITLRNAYKQPPQRCSVFESFDGFPIIGPVAISRRDARRLRDWLSKWLEATGK